MGMRGPARTPTELLKTRGSQLVRKGRGEGQAEGPKGRPVCPAWLDGDSKIVWRQVVGMLAGMGVLTKIDGKVLERYCVLYMQWRKAVEFVRANGQAYPVKDGAGNVTGVKTWPQFRAMESLNTSLLRIEQQFGMTPSSRSNIKADVAPAEDPFDAINRRFSGPDVIGKVGA